MKTSQAGIDLIKKWEGCRLDAYKDVVGVWTIGYGHTSAAGAPTVTSGMKITQQEAEDILKRDLGQYEKAVDDAITKPMNDNQNGALVSLCYNIGPGAFAGSTVVKRFNAGDVAGAADAILMWNKANGQVVQGLVNRREDERKFFLSPVISEPVSPPHPEVPPAVDMSQYISRKELAALYRAFADALEEV